MDELQNRIRYHFKSVQLLEKALHPAGTSPLQGNKQLGLVGDSVLSISILDGWYDSKKKKKYRHACLFFQEFGMFLTN